MELRYQMTDVLPLLPIPQPPQGRSSYNIPCPICDRAGSGKRHLNINLKRNVFRCPKCGQFEGGVFDLYAYYTGVPREEVFHALRDQQGGNNAGSPLARTPMCKPPETPEAPLAGIEVRDKTYHALLEKLALENDHRDNLLGRGLSDKAVAQLEYRSTPQGGLHALAKELMDEGHTLYGVPGFYRDDDGWTVALKRRGIVIPSRDMYGRIQSLQIRLDKPIKRGGKFLTFSSTDKLDGAKAENWCHIRGSRPEYALLIEGFMKADIVHYFTDQTVVAVPGVTSLHHLESTLRELIGLGLRYVMTCFDMDYLKNWHVESAYTNLIELLGRLPLEFGTYLWSPEYNGMDDFIWEFMMERKPKK